MTHNRSRKANLSALGVVAAVLLATSTALLPPRAHADTAPMPTDAYGSTAMAQAMQTGQPVTVDSTTTETSQVTAEPNGQFQLTSSRGPVRAQTSSGWQPIDTTLQATSDGTFSPKITTIPVTFSGGGNSLLVGIGTSQQGINTYWPTNLPTPTISGDTATYPNVRPNVNLVMTAHASGFSETLVINTPAAAQDIVNNPATVTAFGTGVTVTQQANGVITGTDASGNTVFGGGAPSAWDSSVNSAEPLVRSNPWQSANATERPLGMTAHAVSGGQSLTVSVPAALLSSPTLHYPLYLDPEIGPYQTNWRTLENKGGSPYGSAESSTWPMRVGYCLWTGCSPWGYNADSFFSFNTTDLVGKATKARIFTAQVQALEDYNAASYITPVNLTRAGAITTTMSYPGPVDATLQTVSQNCGYNGGGGCFLNFNNSNVINYMQDDANSGWTNTTFALTTPDTNNANYWKKFGSAPGDEVLTVTYDFPPTTPGNLSFNGNYVDCRPQGQPLYLYTSTPTVSAKAYSQDGMRIGMYFQIQNPSHGELVTQTPTPTTATGISGSQIAWQVPQYQSDGSKTLPDGRYEVHAQAQDLSTTPGTTGEYSPWSNSYAQFTVRTTGPDQVPTVTSHSFPSGYWGVTPNDSAGAFTFKDTSTDTAGIAGFSYSIDTAGGEPAPNGCAPYDVLYTAQSKTGVITATNGAATWKPPTGTLTPGYHILYVKAFNNAHISSAESVPYPFYVAPTFHNTTASNLVEAESLPVVAAQNNPASSTISTVTDPTYSAGDATQIVTSAPSSSYTFTLNPTNSGNVPVSGYYAVGVQLLTGSQNAQLTFTIDDTQVATRDVLDPTSGNKVSQTITQDTCNTSGPGTVFVPLGGFKLDATTPQKLTVTMTGTSCGTSGYTAGIDNIILAPINDVTYTSLAAAFNNHGIESDGAQTTPQATFDGTPADNALSTQALLAANPNFTPTATFAPDPYTKFTMPTPTSNGDNAIATGQTITMTDKNGNPSPAQPPIPNSNTPGYVDFLVGSTCGPVTASQAKNFTLTYDDGTPKGAPIDTNISPIPQWTDPAASTSTDPITSVIVTPVITAGYSLTGSPAIQRTPTQGVTLYVVKVPWDPNHYNNNVTSVTLPRIGTDFTNTCDPTNNALHVFAITTSTQ